MAAKAKRKRRGKPAHSKPAAKKEPSLPALNGAEAAPADPGTAKKPVKRLERQVDVSKKRARDRPPEPHKFDIRHGVERPKAIWHPFPLTGIAGLIGTVILALGFINGPDEGASLIGAGGLILTVAVGEMCLREHMAGFRSHSLLLGFLPVMAVQLFVYYVVTDAWIGPIALFVDATVFGMLVLLLHGKYRTQQRAAQERTIAASKQRRRR